MAVHAIIEQLRCRIVDNAPTAGRTAARRALPTIASPSTVPTAGRASSGTDRGQLAEVQYQDDVIDARTYDDGGRLAQETHGNGLVTTYTYTANENLLDTIANSAVGNCPDRGGR